MSRKIHELKTWPEFYWYVALGSKRVEEGFVALLIEPITFSSSAPPAVAS